MSYKRLTSRNKFGFACYNGVFTENGIQEIINRLAELEDKIENGTLVEFPCKVGDTVWYAKYYTFNDNQTPITILESWEVFGFLMWEDYTTFKVTHKGTMDYRAFGIEEIGDCWFLTKAKADAKLKELKDLCK